MSMEEEVKRLGNSMYEVEEESVKARFRTAEGYRKLAEAWSEGDTPIRALKMHQGYTILAEAHEALARSEQSRSTVMAALMTIQSKLTNGFEAHQAAVKKMRDEE